MGCCPCPTFSSPSSPSPSPSSPSPSPPPPSPSPSPSPSSSTTTNWQIDKYEITKRLGKGGYAEVVAARDPSDNQLYAIKISLKKKNDKVLLGEGDVLTCIGPHNHIVGFYGAKHNGDYLLNGIPDKKTYLNLELCENGSFFDLVSMIGGLEEQLARTYFKQLLNAVEFMHKKKFAHRDLKPENLLVDNNWILKVADLGLACKIDANGHVTDGKIVGTPGYLGPEVRKGDPYGTANDVFAMGILLFSFALARPPFRDSETTCPWFNKIHENDWSTYWTWQTHEEPLKVSEEFKQIIQKFFNIFPQNRITIPEIKKDPWFLGPSFNEKLLPTKMTSLLPHGNPQYSNREDQICTDNDNGDLSQGKARGFLPSLSDWNIAPKTLKENCFVPPTFHMERQDSEKKTDKSSYQFLLTYDAPVRVYTKWTTDDNPCIVFSALQNICDTDEIEYKAENFMLDCTFKDLDNGKTHEFAIQIFKKEKSKYEEGHQCVVEFGRKSSDGAFFRKLFTSFRNQLDCYVLKANQ